MTLYSVTDSGDEPGCGGWWLVWAPDPAAAVARCGPLSEGPECLTAEPVDATDCEPEEDGVHLERRVAVQRATGWRVEGDSSCDTCSLFEMDGLFPVCSGCRQCEGCGCDCEGEEV